MLWQVVYIKMNTNDAQKSVSAPFLKKADVTKGLVSFFFFFFLGHGKQNQKYTE